MKYMGSKSKIIKYLVPIIQSMIDKNDVSLYWEPFVGGANVIQHIKCQHKYGSDANYYLIELLRHLDRLYELPTSLSREHYNAVRNDYNHHLNIFQPWYVGAIGFLGSYCGRFFDGGFAQTGYHFNGSKMVERDYYNEALRNLQKQAKDLEFVEFRHGSYNNSLFQPLKKAVIYCDPPYKNAKTYSTSTNFDHEAFWDWCRKMSEHNIVLISEQTAPEDFECIWSQEVVRTIKATDKSRAVEKVFIYGNSKTWQHAM